MLTAAPHQGDSNKSIASKLHLQLWGMLLTLRKLETDTPKTRCVTIMEHQQCT